MKTTELALICSSSPGFLRSAGTILGREFRLIECYTLAEAIRLMHQHLPALAVIDLRGNHSKNHDRTWAAVETAPESRLVLITSPGQLRDEQIPMTLLNRFERLELAPEDRELKQLTQIISATSAPETKQPPVTPDKQCQPDPIVAAEKNVARNNQISDTRSENPAAGNFAGGGSGGAAVPARLSVSDRESSSLAARFRTRTPELRQMLQRLEIAGKHDVTLLLIGETGSGKTHLAKLIHEISTRAHEPFLHVACGALPAELTESELFGHVRGAFTSAHADKDGKFLVAGNGTILLDEIDVLTPDQQVKLLRVIEKGEFEPVGSNKTLHVRARIIAASNLQLQPLVEQGRFRPDLYYRLNTLSYTIPPLRKRMPDIEPLARYFVHRHASKMLIDVIEICPSFIECLLKYPWPGNVRELENAVRSAVIYSDNGRVTADTLPPHIVDGIAGPSNDPSTAAFFAVRKKESLENRIGLTEKDIIQQTLLNNNFSRTNTARHLGISRVTLYNKMRKYGIMPER